LNGIGSKFHIDFYVYNEYVACQPIFVFIVYIMKKDIILTVRVDEKMYSHIHTLAKKDDRTHAWMIRRLLEEALQERGLIKANKR
jgi:hypothetical protein